MAQSRTPRFLFLTALALGMAPAITAQNPLAKPAAVRPQFVGEFTGEQIALELGFSDATGKYIGSLTFQGQRYPCSGAGKDGKLVGTFVVNGDNYEFVATRSGDEVVLTSDGNTYKLTAKSAAPAVAPGGGGTPAAAQGGVGIAFRQNVDGAWVIEQVAPGGPAAKQNLRPGMVLRAVDGKAVDGMARDQVRALCVGAIGTLVTLRIETDSEALDVIVQRGALPEAAAPAADAPAKDAPTGDHRRVAVAPTGGSLPKWMKTGTRITFYTGSASLPGVTTTLEQDDQGNWVDQAGRRYSAQDQSATAGAGYTQYDLAHVGADGVAAHMNNFVFMDPQLGTTTLTSTQGFVGDGNGLGDVWIHPARLAAMQEQESRGFRVRRLRYPLNGREYDAITTQTTAEGSFSRTTYDLDTGLLLAMSSSTVGRSVYTPNPNGTATTAAGVNTIVSVRLLAVRDLDLPWAGQGMPPWLQGGRQLQYRGTYRNSLSEGLLAPWTFEAVMAVDRVGPGFGTAKLTTRLDYGNGAAPQVGTTDRVIGAGMIGTLFLDPAVARRLQPGQVIDQDPITRRRTTVIGRDDSYVTIGEAGPLDSGQWTYEMRSGMLVGVGAQQQQGPATITIQAQLAR